MMAPTLAFDDDGLALAARRGRRNAAPDGARAGARGRPRRGSRASGRGRPAALPRDGRLVHREAGVDEAALDQLEADGRTVRRWPGLHHYFGGVSAIGRDGAAADPRRSGAFVHGLSGRCPRRLDVRGDRVDQLRLARECALVA